jgi:hypothetical protein
MPMAHPRYDAIIVKGATYENIKVGKILPDPGDHFRCVLATQRVFNTFHTGFDTAFHE